MIEVVKLLKGIYIKINNKKFKRFFLNKNYFISEYGDVYSLKRKKFLKPYIDKDGYKRCDIYINGKQKHIKIHKIVYLTFVNSNYKGQINHRDDNKFNNHYSNLYVGNQKENIKDCFNNNHRIGNIKLLKIYDKDKNVILTFCPSNKFYNYCGYNQAYASIKSIFDRKWFKSRYKVLEFKNIKSLEEFKSVTTIGDECSQVG